MATESRFTDRGEVARGTMGVVRRVFDAELDREIAVKEVAADADDLDRESLLREARITGRLDHPNVVPVHDIARDPTGRPARLSMKLVAGRSLATILDTDGPPAPGPAFERLLDAFLRVCDAVAFAHSRGFVHRDLKPENVMIGDFGQVYVMDWGLAETIAEAARPRRGGRALPTSGTPAYMAPEQARGEPIDERTDVFALGGILYAILTGRPPYLGESLDEMLPDLRTGRIVPPDLVTPDRPLPAALCTITMRALAADPAERPPSVLALQADVESFVRGGGWFATARFAAGTTILVQGEPGDVAYVVTEGRCEIVRVHDGREELLRVVGPGEVFGEVALITGVPRTATVRARTDVAALAVTRPALDRELARCEWMRAFVHAAAERFLELDRDRAAHGR